MTGTRSRHVRTVARSPPSARSPPRYDLAHGRLRPDDPDPAMDPAGRPPRSPRPRVPACGEARARPLPFPHGERHRVHAQPARTRPHTLEAPEDACGPPRLHDLRRRRRCAPDCHRCRRDRPGAERRRSNRRVRHRGPHVGSNGCGARRRPLAGLARRPRPRADPDPRADERLARVARAPARSRATRRTRSRLPRELRSRSCSSCSRRS